MNATGNHRPLEPLDAAGVGTWVWQIVAGHITLSPQAVMLLGGTAANYTDFLELIRAPDRDAVALALSSSHASREGFDFEFQTTATQHRLRACGRVSDTGEQASGILIEASGSAATVGGQAEVELREREAHLRSVLDTVPDAMIAVPLASPLGISPAGLLEKRSSSSF